MRTSWTIKTYDTLDSTMEEARRLLNGGELGRVHAAIWTKTQTGGRGRHGRTWISPPGNLYVSLILPLSDSAFSHVTDISFLSAVAVGVTLKKYGCQAQYKWPNDLLVAGKKISGILLETFSDPDHGQSLIIGIGANLEAFPEDLPYPATSLKNQGAQVPGTETFLKTLLASFDEKYALWCEKGFEPLRKEWLASTCPQGTVLSVRISNTDTVKGAFVDLDDQGRLLLKTAEGVQALSAGDVLL